MVVDDEKEVLDSVALLLESRGYRVVKACDGKECLEKVDAKPPDLMLLDIMMPDMTGEKVAEAIRKRPGAKKTRIVMLSAATLTKDEMKKMVCGQVVDFIEKPFDISDLLARVKKALGKGVKA